MTLMAHLDAGALTSATAHTHHDEPLPLAPGAVSGSGNWGYTAPDGRRFALTGLSTGLSIVEVTDPARPRNVALIPGAASQWREVKTYGPYAYVTTEAKAGLDIVDLSNPDHPEKVATYTATFKSAHTLWIDAERRLLFANGAGDENGRTGLHILSLEDPTDPVEVGVFDGFYVHDSFTRGGVLYASAIFDGFEALVDVSDPRAPRELSRFFTGNRFTHSSALTPDGRWLFTTDERPGAPLEGWDMANPASPRKVSEFIARPGTIPHNVQIDGTRLVVSHYTEGVYLLDISDPTRPRELGHYDTYDGTADGFHGAWGAYLFPGTNLIVVSDIEGGLFVVRYDG
jgi:choice-of-anchor B domain-containing protein